MKTPFIRPTTEIEAKLIEPQNSVKVRHKLAKLQSKCVTNIVETSWVFYKAPGADGHQENVFDVPTCKTGIRLHLARDHTVE